MLWNSFVENIYSHRELDENTLGMRENEKKSSHSFGKHWACPQ
jgi:hypothetical protein